MNAPFDESTTPPMAPPRIVRPQAGPDWRYWARRLLVCNPFFLCSAAMLLFGVNRLSLDPNFLGNETHNLLFNFGALQFYGGLVAVTAIVLSQRGVWYDSALLVVLEHGLVLVPFILISQAALIDPDLARILVAAGAAAAAIRAGAVSRWYPQFNLPPRALLLGAALLSANVALPLWFRAVVKATSVDDWPAPNHWVWLAALPLAAAGANLLPRPVRYGGLNPERSWLPIFIYAFWLGGSIVHAASVAYLGKGADITPSMVAPLATVVCWTVWNRLRDFVEFPPAAGEKVCLILAAGAPLLSWGGPTIVWPLALANAAALAWISLRGKIAIRRMAGHLSALSAVLFLVGLPDSILRSLPFHPSSTDLALLALGIYGAACGWKCRHPAFSLLGGVIFVIYGGELHPFLEPAVRWHLALAGILCHSIRWENGSRENSRLRAVVALLWTAIPYLRDSGGQAEHAVSIFCGTLVAGAWGITWWATGRRVSWNAPAASMLVVLSKPIMAAIEHGSAGLWALIGSFGLFGAGAILAWKRRPNVAAPE